MVILNTQPIQRIEKQGKPKFRNKTTAKSMRGWITGYISRYSRQKNTEMEFCFREILNAYNYFHPEKTLEVPIEKWRSKSTFQIIDSMDKITVIKYERINKDDEPEKFETKINKEEIKLVLQLLRNQKEMPTSLLAMKFSNYFNLGHSGWKKGDKPIYSDRSFHNKITILLRTLDNLGLIKYHDGKSTDLNRGISFQQAIDNFLN